MKKKMVVSVILLMVSILIVACSEKTNVEDEIHEQLNDIVEREKDIDDLQKNINKNANKERAYYDDIIGLKVEEEDSRQELVENAELKLTNNEELINEIKEKLALNMEKIDSLPTYSEKLDTKEKKETFTVLYELMKKRLQTMEQYYDTYLETIATSEQLYSLFLTEGMQTENVYDAIDEVNDTYESLMDINDDINVQTESVNEEKAKFYELMNG